MTDKELLSVFNQLKETDDFSENTIAMVLYIIAKTFGQAKEETEV